MAKHICKSRIRLFVRQTELFEVGFRFFKSCIGSAGDEFAGFFAVTLPVGKDATQMDGFGRIAGTFKIARGRCEVAGKERGRGCIEIGHRVGWIHPDGCLHDLVVGLRSRLVGRRHAKHLVETQLLRFCLDNLAGFLDGEGADGVADSIVAVAERRIPVFEYIFICGGKFRLNFAVLAVGFEVRINDCKDGTAVRRPTESVANLRNPSQSSGVDCTVKMDDGKL